MATNLDYMKNWLKIMGKNLVYSHQRDDIINFIYRLYIERRDELLSILRHQHISLLAVLKTIPSYSKDESEIISVLNSYSPDFYDFSESLITEVVGDSVLSGVPTYCGTKESKKMAVGESFFNHVKTLITVERILIDEVDRFQQVTINRVLYIWRLFKDENKDMDFVIKNLNDFNIFNVERAQTILDSIILILHSVGQMELARFLGMQTKKWVVVDDEKVRELHQDRNGLIAPLDGLILGARWPGDPRLSLEDTINCRCWLEFCGE